MDITLFFLSSFVLLLSIAYLQSFYITLVVTVICLLFPGLFVVDRFRGCCSKSVPSMFSLAYLIASTLLFRNSPNLLSLFSLFLAVWIFYFYARKYINVLRFVLSILLILVLWLAFVLRAFEVNRVFVLGLFVFSGLWLLFEILLFALKLKSTSGYFVFVNIFFLLFSFLILVGVVIFWLLENHLALFAVSSFSLLIPFGVFAYELLLWWLPLVLGAIGMFGSLVSYVLGKANVFWGSASFGVFSFVGWVILAVFYDFVASPLRVMRDIEKFKQKLFSVVPRDLGDIISMFNDNSSTIKLRLIEEKSLPLSLLTQLVASDRILFNNFYDKDYISRFMRSNKIVGIFRVSDVTFETFYLLIRKVRGPLWVSEEEKALLDELVNLVASFALSVLGRALDEERENFVREVEAFDKVREFLIRGAWLYFFKDRVVAYKFVEDLTEFKGYYFDIFLNPDRLFAFLMQIPDKLLLSSFALLALKGLIKTFPISYVTHENLEVAAKNFISGNDLPLTFYMSSVELIDNVATLRISENDNGYVFTFEEDRIVVKEVSKTTVIHDFLLIVLSNRNISDLLGKFSEILYTDFSKEDKAKKILDLVSWYDTFIMVIL